MKLGLTMAAVGMLAVSALAAPLESGLKAGESASAFQVVDVTGPNKSKELCYV